MRPAVERRSLRPLVLLGAAATVVVALVFTWSDGAPAVGHSGWAMATFTAAIAASAFLVVRGPSGALLAPVSQAVALGLVFASEMSGVGRLTYTARGVVVMTAIGLMGGAALRWVITRRGTHWGHLASRQIAISLAAVLFRTVTFFDGATALERYPDWSSSRWRMTLLMFLIGLIAAAVEIVLTTLLAPGTRPLPAILLDNVKATGVVALAAVSTGIGIALGLASLGPLSILLMVFPLLLLHFTIRQRVNVRRTRRQTIAALSRLTEVAGYTPSGHAQRVAKLSVRIGEEMQLSDRDLVMLEDAALLHDIGQVYLAEPIPGGATVEAAPMDQQHIAHGGAEIVRRSDALDDVARIMEAQSTQYREVREMGQAVPLASRIIKVCNAYDDLTRGIVTRRDAAVERLYLGLGYEYDPEVLDVLVRVVGAPATHLG